MDKKRMFTIANLIFASKRMDVIGSLYFRAKEGKDVYRGRIRLCHEEGPQITFRKEPEKSWELGNEAWFYKTHGIPECYGDIVSNENATLEKATGKDIYEKYTNGTHPSRGKLVLQDSYSDVTQEKLDLIIRTIETHTGKDGKCPSAQVGTANNALINLENMPGSLKQKEGIYGC